MTKRKITYSAGFLSQQSSSSRSVGYHDEQNPTVLGEQFAAVVIVFGEDNELSKSDRPSDGEQSSRQLLRTRCI